MKKGVKKGVIVLFESVLSDKLRQHFELSALRVVIMIHSGCVH
jgi:hypothetical protein